MSALLAPLARLDVIRRGFAGFWRWWFLEMVGILPPAWRSRLHLMRERLELRLTDSALELSLITAEGTRTVRTFAPDKSEAAALVETLEATRGKDRTLLLRLAGRRVLVRELILPAAAEENLNQVLRYEMDRYTPFKADDVYHGFRVLGREGTQGLRVCLVVVPREFLDFWLHQLMAWGVYPDRVEADQVPGVDLSPSSHRAALRSRWPGLRAILAGAVLVLLLVSLLLPLWTLREVTLQLHREVAEVQHLANRAQVLREERDQLLGQSRVLIEKKNTRYPAVTVLNEMAALLPDDTWVRSLQLNDGRLVIQGYSAAASLLIGRIEASPVFDSVGFVAPVTREGATHQDVFQIGMAVREVEP